MDVKIFDNFLSSTDLITIEKYVRGEKIPWIGEVSDRSNPYNLSFFSQACPMRINLVYKINRV